MQERQDDQAPERERFAQPDPGAAGHDEEEGKELEVEPEVGGDEEGAPAEQSEHADDESKHSYPASDPPANY